MNPNTTALPAGKSAHAKLSDTEEGRLRTAFALLGLLASSLLGQSQGPRTPRIVFTHVTIVDASATPARPETAVVVTGNKIAEIGQTGRFAG